MESVFILTAVAGATELLRRLYVKDFLAAASITAAAIIGILAALLSLVDGLTVANGLVTGLSASGLITVASRISSGSSLPDRER